MSDTQGVRVCIESRFARFDDACELLRRGGWSVDSALAFARRTPLIRVEVKRTLFAQRWLATPEPAARPKLELVS